MLKKEAKQWVLLQDWLLLMDGSSQCLLLFRFFSGLEDLNKDFISNLLCGSYLKALKEKKVIPNIQKSNSTLKSENEISHFLNWLKKKSLYRLQKHRRNCLHKRRRLCLCKSKSHIETKIFSTISYPSFKFMNEVIMESSTEQQIGYSCI